MLLLWFSFLHIIINTRISNPGPNSIIRNIGYRVMLCREYWVKIIYYIILPHAPIVVSELWHSAKSKPDNILNIKQRGITFYLRIVYWAIYCNIPPTNITIKYTCKGRFIIHTLV